VDPLGGNDDRVVAQHGVDREEGVLRSAVILLSKVQHFVYQVHNLETHTGFHILIKEHCHEKSVSNMHMWGCVRNQKRAIDLFKNFRIIAQ
jgi:hypothetical protein